MLRRELAIPLAGIAPAALRDSYAEQRGGTRRHEAMDILAPRGTPVLSAADGRVSRLLNSKAGDVYVFAGQDTANPPLPDTSAAVIGPAVLASDTATAPFSATLGAAPPTIEVGEGQRVQVGVLANRNTLTPSAAPTTGSYVRDILKALATLSNATAGPGLQAMAASTHALLGSAVGAIAVESGALGDVQSSLAARHTQLGDTVTALNAQVDSAENVDMAATLTKVSLLQTKLQTSYQLIAGAKSLNLAQYL